MPEYTIRAVAFHRDGWWIGQCLEVALATQTRALEELPHELERLLTVQIQASLARGVEPFTGLEPAPKRFWEMYERARARLEPVAEASSSPSQTLVRTETRLAA
jgi:hypothetical protein